MEPEILVSVVIPVKNGDSWLLETIPAILQQQVDGPIEIIAIDSGSTDKTLSVLAGFPVRVITIKPEDFNHGLTRNLGVVEAKGKFVVMTVQDAKPVSGTWLQQLLDGFTDTTVAGVCGLQIVPQHHNKNPVEWFRPVSVPSVRKEYFPVPRSFNNLSPQEQLAACNWDDVNAMYRTDVLLKLPFRETDFAEDALWARDALMAGYAIVYNPRAQVAHYHHENDAFVFKRNFIIRYHFYKYFGVLPGRTSNNLLRMARTTLCLLKEKGFSPAEKWKWFWYNYRNQRAADRSNDAFLKSLEKGKEQIEAAYADISKSIPQALKVEG